jgi:Flp pilus assembly protein CpaB
MAAVSVRVLVRRWSLRLGGWPRRLLALGLLLAAALAATTSHHDPAAGRPPPTVAAVVAARDLPAGTSVGPGSARVVRLPVALAPAGVLSSLSGVAGRTVGAPLRRGEPITDVRLVGPALAASLAGPGAVAAPVRLTDSDTAALLRPGDRVDVLAAPERGEGGAARIVAADARVMVVPPVSPNSTADGSLVVLATTQKAAQTLAAAATSGQITVTLRANR